MTDRETAVSIVIPCFNAGAWLRDALASALEQQSHGMRLDVVVVDDGSTDSSRDIARSFAGVRVLESEHLGASHARNMGTDACAGALIQYLDADDVLAPGKIRKQLQALHDTEADVAYGDWRERAAEGPHERSARVVSRQIQGSPELALFTDFWCPPAAYLFRRTIVERIGGWNPRLPVIQDARFALDCALHGARFVYTPGVVAEYRVHADGSLSRRDPVAFVRDVYTNAREVEEFWRDHGGLTSGRREALVTVLSYVARASWRADPDTFDRIETDFARLGARQARDGSRQYRFASALVGLRGAERLASVYRFLRRRL